MMKMSGLRLWSAMPCSTRLPNQVSTAWKCAGFDSRNVWISSGIENAYAKGPADQFGNFTLFPDKRNLDGSIAVDSVVQWQDASAYTQKGWQVTNFPFTANASGFQSPSYAWSLLGQGNLTPTININVVNYTLVQPDYTQFPMNAVLTVSVTDSDQSVASNTYAVTWHLPVDNWRHISDDAPVWQTASLVGTPKFAYFGGSVSAEWIVTDETNGRSLGLGDMFAAGSGLVDPPWAAFVALAGVVLSKTEAQDDTSEPGVVFNLVWGDSQSTIEGGTPPGWPNNSPDVMDQYQMKPEMLLQYQTQHYQGDQYGLHGYIGQTTEVYDQWIGWDFAGDFSLISQPPPPP